MGQNWQIGHSNGSKSWSKEKDSSKTKFGQGKPRLALTKNNKVFYRQFLHSPGMCPFVPRSDFKNGKW